MIYGTNLERDVALFGEGAKYWGVLSTELTAEQKLMALEAAEMKEKYEKQKPMREALQQPRQPFQGIGAGIHNDRMYFGTSINIEGKERTAIITSEKKVFVDYGKRGNEIKEDFGVNYRFPFFGDLLIFDWSYKSIYEFVFGKPEDIGLKACYDLIIEKQKKYVWHPQEGYPETIACDILSSYFIPIFPAKGRSFFIAEKGSGKTQQANIYAGLAFHALFSGNMSGASIYRIIESVKPTAIVDDFDKIPEEQKTSFDQTLRVGYKKGAKAIRTDDKRPLGFDLYSHMIINNIYGLDDVSESRCSKHILERAPEKFRAIDVENALPKWQKERDLLYTNALLHWKEVEAVYNSLDLPEFNGRERERDAATLTIAKIVGCDAIVKKYLLANNNHRSEHDAESDYTFHLLFWLKKQIEVNVTLYYEGTARSMAEGIAENCLEVDEKSQNYKKAVGTLAWKIGKLMGKMQHAIKTRVSAGKMLYKVDMVGLVRIAWAKGYSEALELEKPELSQPCPPSKPCQPNQPCQPVSSISSLNSGSKHKENSGGHGGQGGHGGEKGDKAVCFSCGLPGVEEFQGRWFCVDHLVKVKEAWVKHLDLHKIGGG